MKGILLVLTIFSFTIAANAAEYDYIEFKSSFLHTKINFQNERLLIQRNGEVLKIESATRPCQESISMLKNKLKNDFITPLLQSDSLSYVHHEGFAALRLNENSIFFNPKILNSHEVLTTYDYFYKRSMDTKRLCQAEKE